MKVLMAPVNIAGQPILYVEELRRQGIDAILLQYSHAGYRGHRFGYRYDRLVDLAGRDRVTTQMETLKACLAEGFDIFHFWLRTLCFGGGPTGYKDAGLDLPFIKSPERRIVYRFTGNDIRLKSECIKRNPYNPYRYGYNSKLDEDMQKRYIEFLQGYVDQFIVGDPELHEYFPAATIVPRAINLQDWSYVGVQPNDCPLIVHAPTDPLFKGTKLILSALEDLKAEGLRFSYKVISNMTHAEAAAWYRKADIAIDQLCMGWYAVFPIECMALGKPVMVYIREDFLDNYHPPIPVENANPDNIKEKLRALIKDFDRRSELGKLGRQYVEEVHEVSKVTSQLVDVYNKVLEQGPAKPNSFADIDYFLVQYNLRQGSRPLVYKVSKLRIIRAIALALLQVKGLRWLLPPMRRLWRLLNKF